MRVHADRHLSRKAHGGIRRKAFEEIGDSFESGIAFPFVIEKAALQQF